MEQQIDVFMLTCAKDLNKLGLAIQSLKTHVKGIKNIHICSPERLCLNAERPDIILHTDFEILPNANIECCKFRKNWIFQQLLKLFQKVTDTEYYLVYDADSVLINDLDFFTDGHPVQYIGEYQNHTPYFDFIQKMSNNQLGREYDGSFICDLGLFNHTYINEMLGRFGFTEDTFVQFALQSSSLTFHLSEFETYGNYMEKYHNGLYVKKQLRQLEHRKDQYDPYQIAWSIDEMNAAIQNADKQKYDIVQIRSGCCNDRMRWQR